MLTYKILKSLTNIIETLAPRQTLDNWKELSQEGTKQVMIDSKGTAHPTEVKRVLEDVFRYEDLSPLRCATNTTSDSN